jgi:hypothetical protein
MTHWSLSNVLFSFQLFAHFLLLFLLLNSSFNALWSDRMHGIISIFLYLLRLALCPKIWSILEKVPWAAEKNVYCAEVGWNILQTSANPFDLWCDLVLQFLYWFFCLDDLSIGDGGIKVSTVLKFIYVFRSFKVCLMKLGALTLGTYSLIIVIPFWCISPFISMKCPSLSHLINLSLSLLCPR